MKRSVLLILFVTVLLLLLPSCSQYDNMLQDGYYTAESSFYNHQGWKQFLTVYVSNGQIITVEYDAKDQSGFVKSWDMEYMRQMNQHTGTYPLEYIRSYTVALLNNQNPAQVDAVSGATYSHSVFCQLAEAVLEQAQTGDTHVVFVDVPEYY